MSQDPLRFDGVVGPALPWITTESKVSVLRLLLAVVTVAAFLALFAQALRLLLQDWSRLVSAALPLGRLKSLLFGTLLGGFIGAFVVYLSANMSRPRSEGDTDVTESLSTFTK